MKKIMRLGAIGVMAFSTAFVAIVLLGVPQNKWLAAVEIMLPYAGLIFSFGFVLTPVFSMALAKYKDCMGTAGAIFGLGYYILISGLVWLMGFIHNGTVYPMPVYFFVLSVTVILSVYRLRF